MFETNQTKIEGSCQSGRKVVSHDSKSDLPLLSSYACTYCISHFTVYFKSGVLIKKLKIPLKSSTSQRFQSQIRLEHTYIIARYFIIS